MLQGFINLNDSQIIFKAIATHEDWLGILVCTPGKGIKKIFSENYAPGKVAAALTEALKQL